jgi:hypothetical protein
MSGMSDYEDEMFRRGALDDSTIDLILSGRDPGREDLAPLVSFAESARGLARRPAPVPSTTLAAILADGVSATHLAEPELPAATSPNRRTKKMALAQRVSGLNIMAKAALGIGIAVAGVAGAGAAGALPDAAQHAVASTVSAVTPFEFPDSTDSHADFGKTTSSDATGASDDQKGVEGQSISSSAAQNGLTTASGTPASDHLPTSIPAGPPADPGSQSSNGTDNASGTPGESHVPTSVPPAHP